jgi:hypothetical protein
MCGKEGEMKIVDVEQKRTIMTHNRDESRKWSGAAISNEDVIFAECGTLSAQRYGDYDAEERKILNHAKKWDLSISSVTAEIGVGR